MRARTLLVLAGFMAAHGFAYAAAADEPPFAGWAECKKEIGTWCSDVKADDSEAMYACLLKHDSSLSKKCDDNDVTPYETKTGKPH